MEEGGYFVRILFAASEAVPFCKTGGLADVAGSLPQALAQVGNEVSVVLPMYQKVADKWKDQMTFVTSIEVSLSWRRVYAGLFRLEKDGVPVHRPDWSSFQPQNTSSVWETMPQRRWTSP